MTGLPTHVVTYRGGDGTFLRTGGWTVLLDVAPGHPLVEVCWDRLGATSEPDDVLETIMAQGLRVVPAFAVVRETDVRRVVARGALALVLDGTDVLTDRHAGAWVDLPLAGVSTVEVSLTGRGLVGPALPLRDGAAAATGFHLVLDHANADADADADADATARRRVASSEETLPTTFTTGPAPAPEPAAERRDRSGRRPLRFDGDGSGSPRVLAAVCPAGHLTPAYSGVCRVCRRVVAAQEAFETPRPALGRLVLPQGDSLLLDRGAVLGRAPHVPAGWAGAQPHLVALPDPDQDVSAQHVAVMLDLWNVLVCDLGSTNGTALVDQSGHETRLRPHEPVALGPGGSIVLADVITLPFEVHP